MSGGGHSLPDNMKQAVGEEQAMQAKVIEHQRNAAKLSHVEEVRNRCPINAPLRYYPVAASCTVSCRCTMRIPAFAAMCAVPCGRAAPTTLSPRSIGTGGAHSTVLNVAIQTGAFTH